MSFRKDGQLVLATCRKGVFFKRFRESAMVIPLFYAVKMKTKSSFPVSLSVCQNVTNCPVQHFVVKLKVMLKQ